MYQLNPVGNLDDWYISSRCSLSFLETAEVDELSSIPRCYLDLTLVLNNLDSYLLDSYLFSYSLRSDTSLDCFCISLMYSGIPISWISFLDMNLGLSYGVILVSYTL